jgi:hypothetical protein
MEYPNGADGWVVGHMCFPAETCAALRTGKKAGISEALKYIDVLPYFGIDINPQLVQEFH